MVTIRWLASAAALLVAACSSGFPTVRPISGGAGGPVLSRFDQYYAAGKTSLRANRVGLALVLFQKALSIEPDSVAALNAVGAAYDELRHPDLAARFYAQALAREPDSADTLNNIAVSAMVARDRNKAVALFQRALARDSGNPLIRANVALLAHAIAGSPHAPPPPQAGVAAPLVERIGPAAFRLLLAPLPSAPLAHRAEGADAS